MTAKHSPLPSRNPIERHKFEQFDLAERQRLELAAPLLLAACKHGLTLLEQESHAFHHTDIELLKNAIARAEKPGP